MFKKLVAIEPVYLIPSAVNELKSYANEVIMYPDIPANDEEVISRIADADAVLVSFTTRITRTALEKCPNVKYIGMCCSLYSPESANVDIPYAHKKGITVTGIRDYGDEGVVEYVISELIRCLHGFGQEPWDGVAREVTGLKAGVIGLGRVGGLIADALHFFGADISYYSRSIKSDATAKGYLFRSLTDLLKENEVVVCCLNRNTVLLHEEEFRAFGNNKILFNIGLSPAWDEAPFVNWLEKNNLCFCDSIDALGGKHLLNHPKIRCMQTTSGRSRQMYIRLSQKVLANIADFI